MTDEQIENEIETARRKDGTFDSKWVVKMNKAGIWLQFLNSGVKWSRTPYGKNDL